MRGVSVSCGGVCDKVRNFDYQMRLSFDGLLGGGDWGESSELDGSSAMA